MIQGNPTRGVEELLTQVAANYAQYGSPLELVFCVLPDRGNSTYLYPAIKRWADTAGGVASQCVQVGKVVDRQKFGMTYYANLLLKLNLKLGGHNVHPGAHGISLVREVPTIVFGADVYHAPPGSQRPSFAAVVASMDVQLATYHTVVSAQPSRCEVIDQARGAILAQFWRNSGAIRRNSSDTRAVVDQMEEIMLAHLRRFFDYNGRPPERILFYRDGVGLSQFAIIQEREISAIRRACRRVGGDTYSPKLVFVVVQKRNHCRIFSMQGNRVDNAQPGTVVDKEITTAAQFDFYMCSHFGLKGTSRPTHYHVLCDDLTLRSDDLQRFTFDLCHLYARCTKIVSSPAPTYYAHLAAYHAHYYMSNFKDEDDNWETHSSISSSDSGGGHFNAVQRHLQDRLYFT